MGFFLHLINGTGSSDTVGKVIRKCLLIKAAKKLRISFLFLLYLEFLVYSGCICLAAGRENAN